MIISCPHCQTKYQVTYEAIGSAGRKVQCAHCHQAWTQSPKPVAAPSPAESAGDRIFEAIAEDALDEAMAAEESAVVAEKGRAATGSAAGSPAAAAASVDAVELQKRQQAFNRRQHAMISSLPLARLRRGARVAGVIILAGLVGGAYFARVPIVERYPDLAGLYERVGLGVNVVGLDFSNLETLKSLSGGNDVLTVSAQIVGRSGKPVPVPPVVISLLDDNGLAVYEWSVTPRVQTLMAGERATFDTRLSLPPSEAVRVRLSFAGGGVNAVERSGRAAATTTEAPSMGETLSAPHEPSQAAAAPAHAPAAAPSTDHAAEAAHAPAPAPAAHH